MPLKSAPSRKELSFKSPSAVDAKGQFEGYLSVFGNIDSYGDAVDQGAFSKTIADAQSKAMSQQNCNLFPILWQHNPYEPIGGFTAMQENSKGLYVKGQLDLSLSRGQHAYSGMKQGYLTGLSIGYETMQEQWAGNVRHLKEIKLYEGSVVTFPANDAATVLAVKSLGIDYLAEMQSLTAEMKRAIKSSIQSYQQEEARILRAHQEVKLDIRLIEQRLQQAEKQCQQLEQQLDRIGIPKEQPRWSSFRPLRG